MPNNDYIKRSEVLKAIRYENWREENRTPSIEELHLTEYQLLAEAINAIPAADVEPVRHGRWVSIFEDPDTLYCSECRRLCFRRFRSNYCPNCGAKMDAEPPKEETVNEITPEITMRGDRDVKTGENL